MQNTIVFKKNYIVELADTLQGHYYGVWLAKEKKVEEKHSNGPNTGEVVISYPTMVKGRFLGYYPSATTFLNAYPTSEQLIQWIAENGFHESRAIRDEKGRQGTRIHKAIEDLLDGAELDKKSYTIIEWHKLDTFVKWHKAYKPEILGLEIPIFYPKGGVAGRLDCVCRIAGQLIVADWKSSSNIHKSFPLQFSVYAKGLEWNTDLKVEAVAALQLGARNKDGYRWILYPDWKEKYYKVFEHVRATWLYDNYDSLKNPKDLPILHLPQTLKLTI